MNQESLENIFLAAFSEYGDAIFRFCVFKVSNAALAEDMTQEVFMRYWQYLRKGNEMTNTRAFLYAVAHNMVKDWYKKKKSGSLDTLMDAGYEPEEGGPTAEEVAAYREGLRTIEDMDDNDKTVLLLRYVEGLDPKDIAEILGESANTVSVRLNRAMKRLQQKLHI